MTDFRFLHAADLHVDSPLRGLGRYEGAPVDRLRVATRGAVENLVRLAIDAQVDLVVLAGDLYDGEWKDYNTGLFFHRQLGRLTEAGIRVVLLHGNHDAANKMTRNLTPPDGVRVFPSDAATTVRFDDLGVALHGRSFATAAETANLAADYPAPIPGLVNIGVLHTALEGDADHARYAPCSPGELTQHGYDYWALGHVHEHRIVATDPWIVFPGNTQGRHARETGPKGCVIVDVRGGVVQRPVFHELDVVRWAAVEVDASEAEALADLLVRTRDAIAAAADAADGRLLACRLTFTGDSALHDALAEDAERLASEVRNVVGPNAWLEKVRLATRPPTVSRGNIEDLAPGLASDAAIEESERAAVGAAWTAPLASLPREIRDALGEDDLDEVLREARGLLRSRLPDPQGVER